MGDNRNVTTIPTTIVNPKSFRAEVLLNINKEKESSVVNAERKIATIA